MSDPDRSPDQDVAELEARIAELEIQLSFALERQGALDAALVQKEERLRAMEEELSHVTQAVRVLAGRVGGGGGKGTGEDVGRDAQDDPVPHSG